MRRHTAEQAVLLSCGFLKLVVNVNRYRVGIVVRSEVGARCGGINRKRLHQPGPRRRYAVSGAVSVAVFPTPDLLLMFDLAGRALYRYWWQR